MATCGKVSLEDLIDLDLLEDEEDIALASEHLLMFPDELDDVSKLQETQRYKDLIRKVEDALHKRNYGVLEDGALEYQLIIDCSALSVDIDNEILVVYNFIRDIYQEKFPELENVVTHPIDYARTVKKIGNETDISLVNLEGLLPSDSIMVVSMTASSTSGKPLLEADLKKTIDACDRALSLDFAKKKILKFFESRMGYFAPNLSAILGSEVAAKLIGAAGGLSALGNMTSDVVYHIGAKKRTLAGFSSATSQSHVGFVSQTRISQNTPPSSRKKACELLAAKSMLAARMDAHRQDPAGKYGRALRDMVQNKIDKWQDLPPSKQRKPLPVPDYEHKRKRGGHRHRQMKERYGLTESRKLANRMQFGVPEESSLGDGYGDGYGMRPRSVKLRLG